MKYLLTASAKPDTKGDLTHFLAPRTATVKGFSSDVSGDNFRNHPTKRPLCSTGERMTSVPRHIVAKALETPTLNSLLPVAVGISPNVSKALGQAASTNAETLLIYCSRGRGWCEMRGRRYDLSPGELLVIQSGTPHSYGADRERLWAVSWMQLAGVKLAFFLDQIGATADHPIIQTGNDPQLSGFFQELLEVIEAGCTPFHLTQAAQSLTRLFELLSAQQRGQVSLEAETAQKIRQSIAYMSEHLDQPLQVAALAAKANISQSHYFALFKRHIDSTPIEYFTQLRIERACHLLSATSMSVKGVAAALGYDDPFYFSRVFRSIQGVAPSDYRRRQLDLR